MRPDGISLVLLVGLAAIVLAELPATGTTLALIRLLLLAVTAGIMLLEQERVSRGFFSLCAGQAVALTGTTPAATVAAEVLLLLVFLRLAGAWMEAKHLLLFAAMAGGVILLFSVTRGLAVPLTVLAAVGLLALIAFPLADYRLKRSYGAGGTHEAVQ